MARMALALIAAGCAEVVAEEPALHALLINGGGRPDENYASHIEHLHALSALLARAAVPADRISVLNADGTDPAPDYVRRESELDNQWLLEGTALGRRLWPPLLFESSIVPGVRVEAATRSALERWFATARGRLHPGDTLLLYVTDHGTQHPRDPLENRITLWGRGESISVRQLRALIERLDPRVRVVALMSQCFSGGFAWLFQAHAARGLPTGAVCGYFSSPSDRPAYGCYPETAGRDGIGHSFAFFEALGSNGRFSEAHQMVLTTDDTPDVPLRTSDLFLDDRLGRAAQAQRRGRDDLVDMLLAEPDASGAPSSEEAHLADRVVDAYGLDMPRSLATLEADGRKLADELAAASTFAGAWAAALADLNRSNLNRFFTERSDWAARIASGSLSEMTGEARRLLTRDLLAALRTSSGKDKGRLARLEAFAEKTALAGEAAYRMEVRLAVLLRLRALLVRKAGQRYLATASAAEKAAFDALVACESLSLPLPPARMPIAPAEPFMPLAQERRALDRVTPGWIGLEFRNAPRGPGIRPGTALVIRVLAGGPAAQAGIRPGDLVIGPPGRPFSFPGEIRVFTMLLPIGQQQRLEVLRGVRRLTLTIVPRAFPTAKTKT